MRVRILRRQSSYWDFETQSGIVRVRFPKQSEHRYVQPDCEKFEIHTSHPVLMNYQHQWRAIYIGSRPLNPKSLLEEAVLSLSKAVGPWRTASEYLNTAVDPRVVLEHGNGLLACIPVPLADPLCALLAREGAAFTSLAEHTPRESMKALVAGPNFVVAKDFRVDETQPGTAGDGPRTAGSVRA